MDWLKKSPALSNQWSGFAPPMLPWEQQFNMFNAGGAMKPVGPFSFLWDTPSQEQGWTPGKGAPQGGDLFGSGSQSPVVKGFLQMLLGK